MTENGSKVFFKPNSMELQTPDGNVFKLSKSGKLFFHITILGKPVTGSSTHRGNTVSQQSLILMQWHNVLGNFNVNYIRKMCDLPHTNLLYMVYTQVYEPYMIDGVVYPRG